MSDYDLDILRWSEHQAALLRRLANGEQVNDQVDWNNVIEEIESVGRSELKAVASALMRAMQHKLYLLGWPEHETARHWTGEVCSQLIAVHEDYRDSMRDELTRRFDRLYRRARFEALRHMVDAPPLIELPTDCPWTLDELLAEGEAALPDE